MRSEAENRGILLNQARRKMASLIRRCSWPGGPAGRTKAMEQLMKLEEVKDMRVFERLGMLCDPLGQRSEVSARKGLGFKVVPGTN
jgi:hypothetical protein